MDFQERLYTLRRRAGLSQEGLANQLGVTRQAVQKWEAGTARPDLENLVALARQFDVSLDYLVTGEESVPRPQAEPGCQRSYADPYVFEYKSKRTLFGIRWCMSGWATDAPQLQKEFLPSATWRWAFLRWVPFRPGFFHSAEFRSGFFWLSAD